MTNALAPSHPSPASLVTGSIIRVPSDGTIGEVTWSGPDQVVIVHGDRQLGRGPWYMTPGQVELADVDQAAAYRARLAR